MAKGTAYMTSNNKHEISRNIPRSIPIQVDESTIPLLTAYGCVLIEHDTGRNYIYTAINLKTKQREVISRRSMPLTTSGVEALVEKIRQSSVAGAGRLEADRLFGEVIAFDKCQEMLTEVFTKILPKHGYKIRKEQMSLAGHILNAIHRRCISLAEAEVRTGKTLAYLVPAIIAKRGRLNGYWNMSFYTGTPYMEMAHMPVVIATSSIALQKAIVKDYIPQLSDILLESGVIKTPLTSVIRKGREHYVCERKLRTHLPNERNLIIKEILESLFLPFAPIDLAEVDGLNAYVKRNISVPNRCDKRCLYRDSCLYLRFRGQVGSSNIDIQVCNHNYLLADTLHRADEKRPLIPNYQCVIIDEAHKFLSAARSMYGVELSCMSLLEIEDMVHGIRFSNESVQRVIRNTSKLMSNECTRLFRRLEEAAIYNEAEDETNRRTADIDNENQRHIRNIHNMADELIEHIFPEPVLGNGAGRKAQLLWELEQIRSHTSAIARQDNHICWLDVEEHDSRLCAIPKDLDRQLYDDLWQKGIPTILTSGTLSAAGDFSRIKRSLGIDLVSKYRLTETSKPSPFNFRENAMIYISETMPFPDRRDNNYILAVANEIELLVYASHGHAAILFTSYRVMNMVWEHLTERSIPFPLFRLDKGGIREIERFKKSGNGVLFAAGALWEGIDIPGDALSMIIIVKLPFAVPDPIGEYEQTLYADMNEYKENVIKPEMLIKTKQGAGRAVRMETDTAVIAILDSRVNRTGTYRACVLDILPDCYVTDDIDDVEGFFKVVKSPDYFI
jgi:ATP-dependent DNA helicase DinG